LQHIIENYEKGPSGSGAPIGSDAYLFSAGEELARAAARARLNPKLSRGQGNPYAHELTKEVLPLEKIIKEIVE
jgi:hypothetical protein